MQSDFSNGVDVVIVRPQQIIYDHSSTLVYRNIRGPSDFVAWTTDKGLV